MFGIKSLGLALTATLIAAGCGGGESDGGVDVLAAKKILKDKTCLTCHTLDGGTMILGVEAQGPTLKGIYGKTVKVAIEGDLTKVEERTVDDDYIRNSIKEPMSEILIKDATVDPPLPYQPVMVIPEPPVTDEQVETVLAYIKTLK